MGEQPWWEIAQSRYHVDKNDNVTYGTKKSKEKESPSDVYFEALLQAQTSADPFPTPTGEKTPILIKKHLDNMEQEYVAYQSKTKLSTRE